MPYHDDWNVTDPELLQELSRPEAKKTLDSWRVVLIGPGGVGKSALAVRFILGRFLDGHDPTIEDLYKKLIKVDGRLCVLDLVDTAGQAEYKSVRESWAWETSCFVLVYQLGSSQSLRQALDMWEEISRTRGIRGKQPICLLVGNKADLVEDRSPTAEHYKEAIQVARQIKAPHLISSAVTGEKVDDVFHLPIRYLRKTFESGSSGPNTAEAEGPGKTPGWLVPGDGRQLEIPQAAMAAAVRTFNPTASREMLNSTEDLGTVSGAQNLDRRNLTPGAGPSILKKTSRVGMAPSLYAADDVPSGAGALHHSRTARSGVKSGMRSERAQKARLGSTQTDHAVPVSTNPPPPSAFHSAGFDPNSPNWSSAYGSDFMTPRPRAESWAQPESNYASGSSAYATRNHRGHDAVPSSSSSGAPGAKRAIGSAYASGLNPPLPFTPTGSSESLRRQIAASHPPAERDAPRKLASAVSVHHIEEASERKGMLGMFKKKDKSANEASRRGSQESNSSSTGGQSQSTPVPAPAPAPLPSPPRSKRKMMASGGGRSRWPIQKQKPKNDKSECLHQ